MDIDPFYQTDPIKDLPIVSRSFLTRYIFSFEAGDEREVLSTNLVFLDDGTIAGSKHQNETRWKLEDQNVLILNSEGTPSCILKIVRSSVSSWEMSGKFLLSSSGRMHYLRPLRQRDAKKPVNTYDLFDTLVARTCYWPELIFQSVEKKSKVKGFAIARKELEFNLWSAGDYSFDDIYSAIGVRLQLSEQHVEQLKSLELNEEWHNLFPVMEMCRRVMPEDIIVSDMYLPKEFIERVVREKCGLHGLRIVVSSHGKHRGTIWKQLLSENEIAFHFGDNMHSDVHQANRCGVKGRHVALCSWSFGEEVLRSIGLDEFARSLRQTRLTSFAFDPLFRKVQLAQLNVNVPLHVVCSAILLQYCREKSIDTVLLCGRDCNLLVNCINMLVRRHGEELKFRYFVSSRDLFLAVDSHYHSYYLSMAGERTLIFDISGTGRTPSNFIDKLQLANICNVYILLKSEDVSIEMERRAPEKKHVVVDHCIISDANRFYVEKLNTAQTPRAIAFSFDGFDFVPRYDTQKASELQLKLIAEMNQIYHRSIENFSSIVSSTDMSKIDKNTLIDCVKKLVAELAAYSEVIDLLPE